MFSSFRGYLWNTIISTTVQETDDPAVCACCQEFYKRAAEMFELADHSESNFSKRGAPGDVQLRGCGVKIVLDCMNVSNRALKD